MIRRAGAPAREDPAGPIPDVDKGEEEEEEEDGVGPCLPVTQKNCLPPRGISVLEKLVKTCPVWLQLGLSPAEVARILHQEAAGTFLVRRDSGLKHLVLCVHFPSLNEGSSEVLEYTIKEEKSILYLEGSVLVFEDIFRLIAFYCVSRDLLPFTLRLPQAILEASSLSDLKTISNLGLGFWDSSLNPRRARGSPVEPSKDSAPRAPPASSHRSASHDENCSCEIELSVGSDRLWFVNPIFIEDCGGALPASLPSLRSRPSGSWLPASDSTSPTSRWAPRRPAPPPPASFFQPLSPSRPPPPPVPALACPLPSSPPVASPHPPEAPPPASPASASHLAPHVLGPLDHPSQLPMTACERLPCSPAGLGPLREEKVKPGTALSPLPQSPAPPRPTKKGIPAAPPRRRVSEKGSLEDQGEGKVDRSTMAQWDQLGLSRPSPLSLPPQGTSDSPEDRPPRTTEQGQEAVPKGSDLGNMPELSKKIRQPPVPPPRKKRVSRQLASILPSPLESAELSMEEGAPEKPSPGPPQEGQSPASQARTPSPRTQAGARPQSTPEFKGSLASLSDSVGAPASAIDQDSYSTSSTEEELEQFNSPGVKKKPSMILGKARHRLSLVSFTSVFHAFLSNDRKLYKKVVELAQDKASYFGSLVQDYKVYSLEMMARQACSTEMLQEIRTMMTQLKSYLLQSTELKALVDPALHPQEELEAIVESSLYKCVLKPLKEAINLRLREIHSKDGSLQQLKENQLVILATTTTDLGVTTSVPEVPVMEKILQKFASMHKAYSPEKKISILLKTCKLIYDSMALSNPGKPYGADDFLPVLMYVLARSHLTEMLLDVEYMMELMDPALQLGEGSYYLTTTYGALEHIKNYDKITVTRQLSMEVQDSIHRWERRRTLNKARASRSSVQDFICVSYLEPEHQSRTLASRADTLTAALCAQCAEKFEVAQPQDHKLFVLVDGRCFQLADDALPHHIKGYLLRSEPKRDFHFVYRPLDGGGSGDPPLPCGAGAQLPVRPGPLRPLHAVFMETGRAEKRADGGHACSAPCSHSAASLRQAGAPHLTTHTLNVDAHVSYMPASLWACRGHRGRAAVRMTRISGQVCFLKEGHRTGRPGYLLERETEAQSEKGLSSQPRHKGLKPALVHAQPLPCPPWPPSLEDFPCAPRMGLGGVRCAQDLRSLSQGVREETGPCPRACPWPPAPSLPQLLNTSRCSETHTRTTKRAAPWLHGQAQPRPPRTRTLPGPFAWWTPQGCGKRHHVRRIE